MRALHGNARPFKGSGEHSIQYLCNQNSNVFQIARDIIYYVIRLLYFGEESMKLHTSQHKSLWQVYLGVSLGEYQLLSNYSKFGRHGYCVIHGTNCMVYVTSAYLNWILQFDWLYHYSGSSTSTIYYGHQTLTVRKEI